MNNEWEKEFERLCFETDWQEMRGDELVSIDPIKWIHALLASERAKIRETIVKNLDKHCIYEVGVDTLLTPVDN